MAKFFGNALGKVFSVVLAVFLLVGVAFAFVGCESDYPQIRITIQFNDNDSDTDDTYVLNYRLSRKMYKQTVNHYIELIDAGFYDGTVIHDYQSNRMVGGGYTYNDVENDDYRDLASLAEAYDALSLTPTVWADEEYTQALNTLYGETAANGHGIDGEGAYTNEKGALGTYTYLDSSELPTPKPVVSAHKTSDGSDRKNIPYQYNAVTSMFYLYTGSSTSADSNFCVFGVLADDDSSTRFDELLDAIDAYEQAMQDEDDNYSFTEVQDMRIDDAMTEFGYYTAEFNIPKVKIVIESIEVTSY